MLERVPHVKATPKPERCVRPAGRPTVHRDGWQRVGARAPDRAGHASRAAATPASPGAWRVRPRRARGHHAPSHPRPLNAHTRPKVDADSAAGWRRWIGTAIGLLRTGEWRSFRSGWAQLRRPCPTSPRGSGGDRRRLVVSRDVAPLAAASGSMSEDDGGGGVLAGGKGAARMPASSAAVGGAGETPATPGVSLATAAAS